MPYNKKNTDDRNPRSKGFDKKSSYGNTPQSGKKNKPEGFGKTRRPDTSDSLKRDDLKSYDPADKNELAPPRFLPPSHLNKPYPAKRNESKSFYEKRPDKVYSRGRMDDKSSIHTYKKRPAFSDWGKDDLAHPKYLRSGGKESYDKKPSNINPVYNKPNKAENKGKYDNDNKRKERYKPSKESEVRKSYKPAFEKPDNDFKKGRQKHQGNFKQENTGDEKRKPFIPKYPTEVIVRKPYHEKSTKTPNERKRELLGTVDEPTDIRLNKYIANSGICARREADELIKKGLITVNGNVVKEMGLKVKKEDIVKYEGRRILPEPFVYVLMNKPKDFITTTEDEKGRKTVMDLLTDKIPQRIYPIGRLDRNTTGVLLLTNDGEVAQALTHPAFEIKKIYHVVLDKKVSTTDLDKLAEGITLEDGLVFADAVSYVDNEDKSHVGVEIHSGKNRVVRRMFEQLGYEVEKLDRVSVGIFTKKDLPRGKWRYLNQSEVGFLMKLKSKML